MCFFNLTDLYYGTGDIADLKERRGCMMRRRDKMGAEFEFKFMRLARLVHVDDMTKCIYYLQLCSLSFMNNISCACVSSETRCLNIGLFTRSMLINDIPEYVH